MFPVPVDDKGYCDSRRDIRVDTSKNPAFAKVLGKINCRELMGRGWLGVLLGFC